MKIVKLTAAAVFATIVFAGYFYFFQPESWRFTVACFTRAPSISACVREDFDFTTDFFGMRLEGNMANLIDRNIFYYGAYEKPKLFLLRDLMHAVAGEAVTFIDIGANTGQHSLFMSRHSKVVHAFEPWEPVLKKFRRTIEINRIENITIHPYGLGNETSRKPFFKPADKNLGTGSFVEGFNVENSAAGVLEIVRGDDAFAKEAITAPSLVKIDIEGYEKLALLGLRKTLLTHRPILVFEMTIDPNSPVSIKGPAELKSLFPEQYEFLVVSEKSDLVTGDYILEPLEGIVRFNEAKQHDLVAYPVERRESILRQGPKRQAR